MLNSRGAGARHQRGDQEVRPVIQRPFRHVREGGGEREQRPPRLGLLESQARRRSPRNGPHFTA